MLLTQRHLFADARGSLLTERHLFVDARGLFLTQRHLFADARGLLHEQVRKQGHGTETERWTGQPRCHV